MLARNKIAVILSLGLILGVTLGLIILRADQTLLSFPNDILSREGPYLQTGAPAVGKLAPDFEARDLSGNAVTLDQFQGKNVLLNFWATWCGPCRVEMPLLEALHISGSQEVQILAVNSGESENTIRQFADELGLTFTLLVDPDGAVRSDYLVIGLPVSVFINKEGIITAQHIGAMTEEQLMGYLKLLGVQN